MARSHKDDHMYKNSQNPWVFLAENSEVPHAVVPNAADSIPVNVRAVNENADAGLGGFGHNPSVYTLNQMLIQNNFNTNDNNTPTLNNISDPNINQFSNITSHMNNFANYSIVNLGNGQMVRVFYDENNQPQFMVNDAQYRLFDQSEATPPLFSQNSYVNNEFGNQNCPTQPLDSKSKSCNQHFGSEPTDQRTKSQFLDQLLGNWKPNTSGTYSPFGQSYATAPNNCGTNATDEAKLVNSQTSSYGHVPENNIPRKYDQTPLAENTKKRIVAEVKPMRPSYSDVLSKNSKNIPSSDQTKKQNDTVAESMKYDHIKESVKLDKTKSQNSFRFFPEDKSKLDSNSKTDRSPSQVSSGSENCEINADVQSNLKKNVKKNKGKNEKLSRKWSSMDDLRNDDTSPDSDSKSQFIFIESREPRPDGKTANGKRNADYKTRPTDKSGKGSPRCNDDSFVRDCQFEFQERQNDLAKIKKKSKDFKSSKINKTSKSSQDSKTKNVNKGKKVKRAGYLRYIDHWPGVVCNVLAWFFNMVCDICNMSIHLSFDLISIASTQTYINSQAFWKISKEWMAKLSDNEFLKYMDRKFGHTHFGFWRHMKWFKGNSETNGDSSTKSKTSTNIPLPATGDEAMKRLLACKGKDPYSILGVSTNCTDEEIKRYYRRQAFLVHPDKNSQLGAEEAFKILQHAFDIIGEPERREMYDRQKSESQHAEAAWSELNDLLTQLHLKMEFAANTIRCTNCGRRHKKVLTDRPCYAARYCAQCKIRHSAKEGDIWAEAGMWGFALIYYACMDGAVYQITQWASCQKKNLKQLRPDTHAVQYRIVLGSKAAQPARATGSPGSQDPNLEEFLNNLYTKSGQTSPADRMGEANMDGSRTKRRTKNK